MSDDSDTSTKRTPLPRREAADAKPKRWPPAWGQTALELAPLVVLVLLALAAPWIAPYSPTGTSAEVSAAPSAAHWFGTDQVGTDIFSRTLYAARLDLLIACSGVFGAFAIAAPLGGLAGYSRGKISGLIMRLMDFLQSFPPFILAMAVVAVAGSGVGLVIVVIIVLMTPIFLRLVRAEVLAIRERAFVDAARSMGQRTSRVVFRHVVPNALGTATAQASTQIGWALLLVAGLSFIGAGVPPSEPEWGSMIATGADEIVNGGWWMSVFPGAALGFAVLAFALAGDAVYRLSNRQSRSVGE